MSKSAMEIQLEREEGEEETLKTKLIREIKERLGEAKDAEAAKEAEACIYKVPSKLRKVKEDAYNPRVVSIGPLHQKNTDLVDAMREHKWRYMLSFLPDEFHKCLEKCTNSIFGLDKEVRQCYATDIEFDKNELAKIMLLDGCFILELFLRHSGETAEKEYGPDPILRSAWMTAALQHDLALLENQIPFFILIRLYDIVKPRVVFKGCEQPHSPHTLAALALKFFKPLSRKQPIAIHDDKLGTNSKHLLDLLHKFYFLLPIDPLEAQTLPAGESSIQVEGNNNMEQPSFLCFSNIFRRIQTSSKNKWGFEYCASNLLESGIQFEKGPWEEDRLLNITFRNGVISIPTLKIDEATISVFRNLIALEQYSLSSTHGVTSYAFLMKSLIRNSADSRLLRDKGIIEHNLIGDQEYLIQFKTIVDEVVAKDDFYFRELRDQVNYYCMSWSLHKIQVYLKVRFLRDIRLLFDTYFSSTWSFTSFLAAFALLILTSLQTYYTIHPRS